jgi:hypothetical protein
MRQGCTHGRTTVEGRARVLPARAAAARLLACCLLLLALGAFAAACGGSDADSTDPKRMRTALDGRIDDALGDDIGLLSRTAAPSYLAPKWYRIRPGAWFRAQKGFVPTMFVVEKPVRPSTTVHDVLDGGRDQDAEHADNFQATQTRDGNVFGTLPGVAYVNSYDVDGKPVIVTGAMAVTNGRVYNAYITASRSTTRAHEAQFRRMLDSVRVAGA